MCARLWCLSRKPHRDHAHIGLLRPLISRRCGHIAALPAAGSPAVARRSMPAVPAGGMAQQYNQQLAGHGYHGGRRRSDPRCLRHRYNCKSLATGAAGYEIPSPGMS